MMTGVSSIYLGYGNRSEFWGFKGSGVGGTAKRLSTMDVHLSVLPAVRASEFPVIKGQINRENHPMYLADHPTPSVRPLALMNRELVLAKPGLVHPWDGGTGTDGRTGSHGRP